MAPGADLMRREPLRSQRQRAIVHSQFRIQDQVRAEFTQLVRIFHNVSVQRHLRVCAAGKMFSQSVAVTADMHQDQFPTVRG